MNTEKQPDSLEFLNKTTDKPLPRDCFCGGGKWYRDVDGKLKMTDHNLKLHTGIGGRTLAD